MESKYRGREFENWANRYATSHTDYSCRKRTGRSLYVQEDIEAAEKSRPSRHGENEEPPIDPHDR